MSNTSRKLFSYNHFFLYLAISLNIKGETRTETADLRSNNSLVEGSVAQEFT